MTRTDDEFEFKGIGFVAVGGAGWMGGANYVRNLGVAVDGLFPRAIVHYLCGESIAHEWRDVKPRSKIAREPSFWSWLRGRGTSLSTAIKRREIEFVYPITYDNEYNLGLRFPITPHLGGANWAGWIPDFQHRQMPEFFAPEEIARRDTLIARLVEEAPRVVLSSESAAADFRAFYPGHATKAHVLTFSTPPIRYPREDPPADAPPRFFLVCNQFWQHKNHLVIFDALQILRSRGIRPIVLCTGQLDDYRDPAYASRIRALLSRENLGEQVTLLGLLPRGRQIALMRQALAVIQPSLFEGWSTVVEDARALGRPTLLSDIPVHREQDPFFAHYFPPQSAEALADLISEAWQHWPAGPNLEEEPFAHARSMVRSAQVGARFLEIAE